MKNIQKPNWTPIELHNNCERWKALMNETEDHDDCICNKCMECFGLGEFMELFSEEEHVSAVNAANELYYQEAK